jgi:hypothetical protein
MTRPCRQSASRTALAAIRSRDIRGNEYGKVKGKNEQAKPKPKAGLPGRDFSVPRPVKTNAIYQGLYESFSDKTYTSTVW